MDTHSHSKLIWILFFILSGLIITDFVLTSVGIKKGITDYNPITLKVWEKYGIIGWGIEKIVSIGMLFGVTFFLRNKKFPLFIIYLVGFIVYIVAIDWTLYTLDIIKRPMVHYLPNWIENIGTKIFQLSTGYDPSIIIGGV